MGSKTPFPPPGTFAPWLLEQHVFSLPLQLAQQRVTSSLLRGPNATIQSDPHPLRLSYDDRCAVESSVAAKILCSIEQLPCSVCRSLGGRRIGTCRASLSQKACLSPQHMQHKSLKFMLQPQHKASDMRRPRVSVTKRAPRGPPFRFCIHDHLQLRQVNRSVLFAISAPSASALPCGRWVSLPRVIRSSTRRIAWFCPVLAAGESGSACWTVAAMSTGLWDLELKLGGQGASALPTC